MDHVVKGAMTIEGISMNQIVILTGAGVSAESGLGTFRDAGGLWSRYDLAEVATPEGFARDPGLVHDFYNARRANALDAAPNAAHRALARLQGARSGVTLITQNIDDLHERGGAREVIHMHGQIMRALCAVCRATWQAPRQMAPGDPCPGCGAPATRPDVVWFGEYPYHMERIAHALAGCDLFVAIGTSGEVYPAAGFVEEARSRGAQTLEITLDPTRSGRFDRVIHGPATETVPAWVAETLGG
jgi:NAD-dependent deacetylase